MSEASLNAHHLSDLDREVLERIQVFGRGGGFVFNTIHNVQPMTPADLI